jgi:hypothetical protein
MRRISGFLASLSLALLLLVPVAMTGCSASGRVRVDNPDHDANHFNSSGIHDHNQYAPHNGENYQMPALQ